MDVQRTLIDIGNTLRCPYSLQPLTQGVTTFPCCCKVQDFVAEHFYGKMVGNICEKQDVMCISCKKLTVFAYFPDSEIRRLAKSVLQGDQQEKLLELRPALDIFGTFPGSSANFVYANGSLEVKFTHSDSPIFGIAFSSSNRQTSLFQSLKISGYPDGTIRAIVRFNESAYEEVKRYLELNGFIDEVLKSNTIECSTKEYVQKLSAILFEKNTFPRAYVSSLQDVLRRGNLRVLPGDKAKFIHESGSLKCKAVPSHNWPILSITFHSSNISDSFFKSFELFGYPSQSLKVCVIIDKCYLDKAKRFFILNGLDVNHICLKKEWFPLHPDTVVFSFYENDIKKLSPILTEYNEIPPQYYNPIKALLDKGSLEGFDFES